MRIKIISTPNQKAFGGDLQSHGATWDNGFTYIGNGGSHEENPHEGVQIGVDPQGVPNLVEEGEVLWNDFVFSKRINMPDKDRKLFKLGGNKPLSYADAAIRLSKESEERPNDPLSQASLNKMLTLLSESQETLKAQREQRKARRQFTQMSPEEQMNIMQMAQQQQMIPQVPQNPAMGMMDNPYGNMSANGGNLFKGGGSKDSKSAKKSKTPKPRTGKYNQDWFNARAKALGVDLTNFKYNDQDLAGNLANFNDLYAQAQRQKAYETYLAGQRKNWENQELASSRYKRGDDGKAVYKAQFYGDADLGKDYISSTGTRITAEEYNKQKAEYNQLKTKAKPTNEEKAKIEAFQNAAYKNSPVVKGQFAKDYSGNIMYDYSNDVASSWIPSDDELGKDFKWDTNNAAQIEYDPENKNSALSYLRYAPALGGAIGLMTDIFTKPDYSRAQEIKNAGAYNAPTINYTPIGNYLRYNPMDINYAQNKLNQEAAATRRAIQNTAGTRGAAMAGLLASDYNAQQASGDLFRKALEYNDALQQKVEDFNRGTNMFNSQQDLYTQRSNQAATQQALRDKYQGILAGNTLMDQIDARRAASMSANLTNLVSSLGQIGEEAYDQDRIDALSQRGVLQNLYKNNAANGGMLTKPKRKKGGRK